MSKAVTRLKINPNTYVYIDAGHVQMPGLKEIVDRLEKVNVKAADGFALNVSNFYSDAELINRANQIIAGLEPRIGKKTHFVIDSSRNGNGSNGQWCNPTGRALGRKPTTETGVPGLDAFLWIKTPGESDGTCAGGTPAGKWFDRLANELNAAPPKDGPVSSPGSGASSVGAPSGVTNGTVASASTPGAPAAAGPGAMSTSDCHQYNRDGRTCSDIGGSGRGTVCKWDQTWECVQGCAKWVRHGC